MNTVSLVKQCYFVYQCYLVKRICTVLVAVSLFSVLLTSQVSYAQTPPASASTYAALSFGLPTVSLHVGFQDPVAGGDLRVRVSASFYDNFDLRLAADLLFNVATLSQDLTAYVGIAPELSYFQDDSAEVSYDFFGLGAAGFTGLNFRLSRNLSIFAEAGGAFRYGFLLEDTPAQSDVSSNLFGSWRAALGVGFYF